MLLNFCHRLLSLFQEYPGQRPSSVTYTIKIRDFKYHVISLALKTHIKKAVILKCHRPNKLWDNRLHA